MFLLSGHLPAPPVALIVIGLIVINAVVSMVVSLLASLFIFSRPNYGRSFGFIFLRTFAYSFLPPLLFGICGGESGSINPDIFVGAYVIGLPVEAAIATWLRARRLKQQASREAAVSAKPPQS